MALGVCQGKPGVQTAAQALTTQGGRKQVHRMDLREGPRRPSSRDPIPWRREDQRRGAFPVWSRVGKAWMGAGSPGRWSTGGVGARLNKRPRALALAVPCGAARGPGSGPRERTLECPSFPALPRGARWPWPGLQGWRVTWRGGEAGSPEGPSCSPHPPLGPGGALLGAHCGPPPTPASLPGPRP